MFDEEATCEGNLQRWKFEENGMSLRKRVVVLVDESREARLALLWALSHVVNNFDIVTLLYIVDCKKTLLSTQFKGTNSTLFIVSSLHTTFGKLDLCLITAFFTLF